MMMISMHDKKGDKKHCQTVLIKNKLENAGKIRGLSFNFHPIQSPYVCLKFSAKSRFFPV
jgi:hypothetical protein